MRTILLASTTLVLAVASPALAASSVTDPSGHEWTITASGSIQEDGNWTPGGGGTAQLAIGTDGTVYGLDAHGRGWFVLSGNGQYWVNSATPATSLPMIVAPSTSAQNIPQNIPPSASVGTTSSNTAPNQVATAPPSCPPTAGVASGTFHVQGGEIIGPDGKPFIAKGVNMGKTDNISAILANFPGLNFVRLGIDDYSPASSLAGIVQTLTSRGIVVLIEDHRSSDGSNYGGSTGQIKTGAALQQQQAWYQDIASTFASNPRVWTASNNEPPGPGPDLANWIIQTYQTVRAAGNTAPFLINPMGGGSFDGMPTSFTANMRDAVFDLHAYGWACNYSTDQNVVNAMLDNEIQASKAYQSLDGVIPVIIGEFGNSTAGGGVDPNGQNVVVAVISAAATPPRKTSGAAAWHVGWMGGMGDSLNNPDGSVTSPYGQSIQLYVGIDPTASPAAGPTAPVTACATPTTSQSVPSGPAASTTATVLTAQALPTTDPQPTNSPAPLTQTAPSPAAPDPTSEGNADADAVIAQASAAVQAQVAARMTAAPATSP